MVDDIVVAVVDAPPVRSGPQRVQHVDFVYVRDEHVQRPTGLAARDPSQVDPHRRVRAARLDRAVQTSGRGAGRSAAGVEVMKRAERLHRGASATDEVMDPVQIVTAFRQKHRAAQILPTPVPANVGVHLVPVPDRLETLDAHDLPDGSTVDQLLEPPRVRRVAEHVADGEDDPRIEGRCNDLPTPVLVRGHRLLEKHVVSLLGERDRRLDVDPVRGGDHGRIGEPGPRGKIVPVTRNGGRWDSMRPHEPLAPRVAGIGDADDASHVGVREGVRRVRRPSGPRAEDEQLDRLHGLGSGGIVSVRRAVSR